MLKKVASADSVLRYVAGNACPWLSKGNVASSRIPLITQLRANTAIYTLLSFAAYRLRAGRQTISTVTITTTLTVTMTTNIHKVHNVSNQTESEVLKVSRWAVMLNYR